MPAHTRSDRFQSGFRTRSGLCHRTCAAVPGSLALLHAIYVPEAAEVNLAAYLEKIESESDRLMTACRKRVEDAGVAADSLVVRGAPSHRITETARGQQVDLIVMGTHGRTGLRHMLIGSVAERVVRHAPCPVMVVPREEGKH